MFRYGSRSRRLLSSYLPVSGLSPRTQVTTVLGAQWGDEGKGKLVDLLGGAGYDVVARFNGGSNAGHTLVVDGVKYAFHLLPCGMLYENVVNVIGNGVVLHVPTLLKEISNLESKGVPVFDRPEKLKISTRAHLLFDFHQVVDGLRESGLGQSGKEIGTTKKGIGPCYASKSTRNGIRVGELFGDWKLFEMRYLELLAYHQNQFDFEHDAQQELERYKHYREILKGFVEDTVTLINHQYDQGKRILVEGANACLLDIDFGTYPYVTSSTTTAGGVSTGLGLAPNKIDLSIGVVKAYTTRVGGGPFPTEQKNEVGDHMVDVGREFGTTTGRKRRCGWLDIPVLQYSKLINGYSSINITKLDVLTGLNEVKIGVSYSIDGRNLKFGEMPSTLEELSKVKVDYESLPGWSEDISKARTFEELPVNAKNYILRIQQLSGVPVSWIGVGAGRFDMATQGFHYRH